MAIPDELVQAAAEAICAERTPNCQKRGCCRFYADHARLALTAAFAKLPKCEATFDATAGVVSDHGTPYPVLVARVVLDALARMATDDGEADRG